MPARLDVRSGSVAAFTARNAVIAWWDGVIVLSVGHFPASHAQQRGSMKQGIVFPNQPTDGLVARAQAALGMTHRQFGEALGASERTSLRWAAGRSHVTVSQLRKLARLVHPRNPVLAVSLAEASSDTLESLGIVPPSPPPRPALPAHFVANLLVCAAADAFGGAPSAARAALRAAFGRAREMGLSVEEVEKALKASVPSAAVAPP